MIKAPLNNQAVCVATSLCRAHSPTEKLHPAQTDQLCCECVVSARWWWGQARCPPCRRCGHCSGSALASRQSVGGWGTASSSTHCACCPCSVWQQWFPWGHRRLSDRVWSPAPKQSSIWGTACDPQALETGGAFQGNCAIVKKKRNRRKNFVQMQLLYINFLLPSLKDTLGSMQSDLGIQCELVLGWVSLTVTSLGTHSWCRHERFGPTPQVGVLGGKTLPNSAICAHSACRVTPCHCTRWQAWSWFTKRALRTEDCRRLELPKCLSLDHMIWVTLMNPYSYRHLDGKELGAVSGEEDLEKMWQQLTDGRITLCCQVRGLWQVSLLCWALI